jgi:hypothetical protein
MDINKLNDRITHLEEQNKALIDYINTTIVPNHKVLYNMAKVGGGEMAFDGRHGVSLAVDAPIYMDIKKERQVNPFEPPLPPRRTPPPLPIAAEIIPILTIPSAPPKPPRKKIMC